MKRSTVFSALSFVAAVLLIVAAAGGAVQVGMVDSEDVSPVEEADALLGTAAVVVGTAIVAGTGGYAIGTWLADGDVASEEEALQQKIDLYQLANTQQQNTESTLTPVRNRLQNTDTMLKAEGMNALQRAEADNATLSEANNRVTNRIDNRTTIKQINIYNAWSAAATNVRYIENVSDNSSGIAESFGAPTYHSISWTKSGGGYSLDPSVTTEIDDSKTDWTKTTTLTNGTQLNITKIPIRVSDTSVNTGGGTTANQQTKTVWVGPTDTMVSLTADFETDAGSQYETYTVTADLSPYVVKRNESAAADNYLTQDGDLRFANATKYGDVLTDLDVQNDEATQAVTDLAASKYSDLRSGAIDIESTISPYYADRYYSTEGNDSSVWLQNMYAAMGVSNPEDYQNVTEMIILSDSAEYEGILMSDGLPANDTFHTGTTYDTADLNGSQFVVTQQGRKVQLSGNFSISEITTPTGPSDSISYERAEYNTTSIDGFKAYTEYLQEQRAESEAREQRKEAAAGGGLFSGISGFSLGLGMGISGIQAIAVLIAAFLALMTAIRSVTS